MNEPCSISVNSDKRACRSYASDLVARPSSFILKVGTSIPSRGRRVYQICNHATTLTLDVPFSYLGRLNTDRRCRVTSAIPQQGPPPQSSRAEKFPFSRYLHTHPLVTSNAKASTSINGGNLSEGHLTDRWDEDPGCSELGPPSATNAFCEKFRRFFVGIHFTLKMSQLGVAPYNATGGNGGDPCISYWLLVDG